ncbi:MAG: response regulator transcription factor [Nitrososphaeraceae archaeon]
MNDTQPDGGHMTEDLSTKVRLLHSDVGQPLPSSSLLATKDRNKRILVVDDDPDVAYSIKIGLEFDDSSIMAHSFSNPVDALLDFTPGYYDILLVDINMPLMNGFELCEKILQKDTNIKICFMTAGEVNMNAIREVHSLRSIGCFIRKPITTEALVRRIRAELE